MMMTAVFIGRQLHSFIPREKWKIGRKKRKGPQVSNSSKQITRYFFFVSGIIKSMIYEKDVCTTFLFNVKYFNRV